ncbi:MAG: hypothetical protein OEV55_09005, partial [candidate division Zixibacteria bacterium]|nr:hypothetical protein [candidate division Zixibacteria bacterium]
MKIQRFIVIALISLTLLGCELVWTRIYSAEFFYSFAFLILSLAILGLGLGALSLRLFGFLNHERSMGIILSLAGFMSLAGPPIAIKLGIDFTKLFISWAMLGKLILTIGLLSSAFFFGGIALALMFRNYHREMPRLYMADLTGAGLGVLLAIILMNHFGTPVASFLVALPVLLAAVLSCRSWVRVVPAIL